MRIRVSGAAPVDMRPVRSAVRSALRAFGLPADAVVSIAFVGDTAMRDLNLRYRGKPRTTDVLSFGQKLPRRARGTDAVAALQREPDGSLEIGDVVISVDQARRQSKRRRRPLDGEIAFLAAHGVLHLMGFEDETRAGYREMLARGTAAVEHAFRR